MVNAWQVKQLQRYDFLVISEKRIVNNEQWIVTTDFWPLVTKTSAKIQYFRGKVKKSFWVVSCGGVGISGLKLFIAKTFLFLN